MNKRSDYWPENKKCGRIIRLFFITLFLLNLSVSAFSQITVHIKDQTIKQALKKIEKNSSYIFFYNSKFAELEKKVSLDVTNQTIDVVLKQLLIGTQISYEKRENNQIVLLPSVTVNISTIGNKASRHATGIVIDGNKEPIIGANVVEKGTSKGGVTDVNGKFSILISENTILQVSYIGYISQEIEVKNQAEFTIVLEEDMQALNEVIVIGYGTTSKRDFTGSVSSVKLENSSISLLPNTNALESLRGHVTGVNIGASNSAGGEPSMLIRGQNSINGSNDPLIVLDGVVYLGSLNDINPNDIASFDVLKDAVSAAAYGSRAANGIIAVTTKKGRSDKPIITFNASAGIQNWANRPAMMDTENWIKKVNDVGGYPEGSTSWMKAGESENYTNGKETVWLDEVTRLGSTQNYQVAVSGSTEKLNYYISTSYNNAHGVILGDDFDRISVLGKLDVNITDWLKTGVDAAYSHRDHSGIKPDLAMAQRLTPVGVIHRNDAGNLERWPREMGSQNALWGVNDGTRDHVKLHKNYRLSTYALVSVPWVKGLTYRLNFQPNIDLIEEGDFYYESYYINEGNGEDRYSPAALQSLLSKANGNLQNSENYSYVFDNIINYKKTFGKHSIDGTLVATRDVSNYEIKKIEGSDFSENGNTTLGFSGLHKAKIQKINLDGAVKRANLGYLGRVSYSFDGKYFFTGSVRRDGASVFGAENKWGTFSAAGMAWEITREKFMEKITSLDRLKLKASWGQNGNQGIKPYTTLSQVANGSTSDIRYQFSDTDNKIYYGLIQKTLGNHSLGWESTDAWNFGFESAWLKNRLFVDLDMYVSKTYDQIFERTIPIMTGFKKIFTSMGQVNNSGIELMVKSVNIDQPNFNWMTSVTFWKNNNKLVKLYGDDLNGDGKEDDDIANSLFIGKSLGAIYGYRQTGIVQEDDTEYIAQTGSAAGSPKYADLDGVPGISADDREILGYQKENFRLNIANNLRYKGFEFYLLISGIFGGNNYFMKSNPQAFLTNATGMFMDNLPCRSYWASDNKSNIYPSAQFAGDGRFLGLQSRGFLRIQDVSLSYTFDKSCLKGLNIHALKVYLAAKNLATFTGWEGFDPETGTILLQNANPVSSSYSIGVNISF